jgi:hypothetical protein
MQNRKEWEERGEKMVEEMVERYINAPRNRNRRDRRSVAIPNFQSPTPKSRRRGSRDEDEDEIQRQSITGGDKASLIETLQNLIDDENVSDDDL